MPDGVVFNAGRSLPGDVGVVGGLHQASSPAVPPPKNYSPTGKDLPITSSRLMSGTAGGHLAEDTVEA